VVTWTRVDDRAYLKSSSDNEIMFSWSGMMRSGNEHLVQQVNMFAN